MLAIDRIASDLEEDERPDIDQDTKNVAGTPKTVTTIVRKVEAASVFVGDITPLTSHGGKHHRAEHSHSAAQRDCRAADPPQRREDMPAPMDAAEGD